MQNQENTIQILPDFLANQIAAGEVVQRPESVVKEIVENALDAGAQSVSVILRGSGKQLIHIIDDGKGMSKEDLQMSTRRHATSKIRTQADLEHISTLGFRGEALASIAAVAYLEIRTCRPNDAHGWRLIAEPGRPEDCQPVQIPAGTQVIIKNLFYNVPARKKFLKSDIVEFRHISETMIRFALSRPEIRFVFYDADTLVFDANPGSLQDRIQALFGDETAAGLLPVNFSSPEIQITGYAGLPHLARQSKAGQHFFLNGRAIVSRQLAHAVFQPYEHLVEKQQHPFFVLNLIIDPEKVDVNVHPQKHEVKFENERLIYNAIHSAISNALAEAHIIPSLQFKNQAHNTPFEKLAVSAPFTAQQQSETIGANAGNDEIIQTDSMLVNRITGEILPTANPPAFSQTFSRGSYENPLQHKDTAQYRHTQDFPTTTRSYQGAGATERQNRMEFSNAHMSAFEHLFGHQNEQQIPADQAHSIHADDQPAPYRNLWQLHRKYIFAETPAGTMIIDQHAAHERILYEQSLKALVEGGRQGQTLLFPIEIQLMPDEKLLFTEIKSELEALGFRFEDHAGIIKLIALPADIQAGMEKSALHELLEQYREYDTLKPGEKRDNLAASMGCRAAIKSGHPLSQAEMKALLDDLFACSMPYACPHGRSIILELPLQEFDKRFGRTS
jgi:DNA mismatch repair protein MutL